jgi:hypothetical protein
MKILLLLLSLNLSLSYAQKLKFGPEIGFNLINVEDQSIGDNYQTGWHTGVFAEYELKKWFGVSAGLYYTQKRQSFESSDVSQNGLTLLLAQQGIEEFDAIDLNTYSQTNGRVALNYLQLPVLAVFKQNSFSFKLGGYFGYMFNTRSKINEVKTTPFVSVVDLGALGLDAIDPSISQLLGSFLPEPTETIFSETTNKDGLSSIDFGLKAGITYQADAVGFSTYYIYGLKDYRSSISTTSMENNSYFQFSISYSFSRGSLNKTHFSKM